MAKKIGRNDLCGCGSGKKAKHCCLAQKSAPALTQKRKLTAKVISAGGAFGEKIKLQQESVKANLDYTTLMERSFGASLHTYEEAPPLPTSRDEYLVEREER